MWQEDDCPKTDLVHIFLKSAPKDLEFIKQEESCSVNYRKTERKPLQHARNNKANRATWQPTQERTHTAKKKSVVEVAIRRHRHHTFARATPTPPSTSTKEALTTSKRRGLCRPMPNSQPHAPTTRQLRLCRRASHDKSAELAPSQHRNRSPVACHRHRKDPYSTALTSDIQTRRKRPTTKTQLEPNSA